MWSVTVGMTGPQGVPEGHQEEESFVTWFLVVVVVGFLGGSSPLLGLAAHQSRDGEARTVSSNLNESWDLGPRGFLPASPWMEQFDSMGKLFPKPQLGGGSGNGGGGGGRRWGFLPPHPGRSGCRASGRQSGSPGA